MRVNEREEEKGRVFSPRQIKRRRAPKWDGKRESNMNSPGCYDTIKVQFNSIRSQSTAVHQKKGLTNK